MFGNEKRCVGLKRDAARVLIVAGVVRCRVGYLLRDRAGVGGAGHADRSGARAAIRRAGGFSVVGANDCAKDGLPGGFAEYGA
jgi:hypothetical protein